MNIVLIVPSFDLAFFYARLFDNYHVHVSGSFENIVQELGEYPTEILDANIDDHITTIYRYIEHNKNSKMNINIFIAGKNHEHEMTL